MLRGLGGPGRQIVGFQAQLARHDPVGNRALADAGRAGEHDRVRQPVLALPFGPLLGEGFSPR